MIDASHEDFEENVAITNRVVKRAGAKGVSVEAELGKLGGVEEDINIDEKHAMLTDPGDAERFVAESECDSLAVAIGTSHGAYKFNKPPTGEVLAIKRIKDIHTKIPNTHLVMHGSSSVPKELLDIINQNGGEIIETYGVPVKEIQEGIKHGVRKVNIDTDLRLAATAAIRKYFIENPDQFDPRKYLIESKNEMKNIVMKRLLEFKSADQASKIKPIPLSIMSKRYSSGELY